MTFNFNFSGHVYIHIALYFQQCNKRMLKEYPNMWAYTRDLYQTEGVRETIDKEHIRRHYHVSK